MKKISFALSILFAFTLALLPAELLAEVEAEDLAYEAFEAAYFPGDDVRWRVRMEITDKNNNRRSRELTVLRSDVGEHRQKYYLSCRRRPLALAGG